MTTDQETIVKALLSGSYITQEDVDNATEAATSGRVTVVGFLTNEGMVNHDIIGQALSELANVRYVDLHASIPNRRQVFNIPANIARTHRVVLAEESEQEVLTATDDPEQEGLAQTLQELFPGKVVTVAFSMSEDIDKVLTLYNKDLEKKIGIIVDKQVQVAPNILTAISEDAIALHASDVHLEPSKTSVLLRFRVDGVLRDIAEFPREQYENVLNHIKVKSSIRLDEHFAAQDGAMRSTLKDKTVDFRVSIVPTVDGEKVVLRVLSSYVQGLLLSELGLSEQDHVIVDEVIKKPFGMIMVTGPTGSGKTTMLYAVLRILNRPDVNITTIEDPVEYKVGGINQIQVNNATNLTFAKGLRSVVRQDPDIILVGEIRDTETAEIAVNAALTGHLLLSTFHANDAATAIPRMLDMGTESFLLASTLELVVSQRLIRTICDHCKQSVTVAGKDLTQERPVLKKYLKKKQYTLYKGNGCGMCDQTGFLGRTAVFELLRVTPEIQELITKNPSSKDIWKLARKQGARSMFEDGIEKVLNGSTTLEELFRVAEPPTT